MTPALVGDPGLAPIWPLALEKWWSAPPPTPSQLATYARRVAGSSRCGGDLRGSAEKRRRRLAWLLGELGDGWIARCAYCPEWLDANSATQDRIWRECGYVRHNLLLACFRCNRRRSDHPPYVGRWDESWWIAHHGERMPA